MHVGIINHNSFFEVSAQPKTNKVEDKTYLLQLKLCPISFRVEEEKTNIGYQIRGQGGHLFMTKHERGRSVPIFNQVS